jgi:hypothetical protein
MGYDDGDFEENPGVRMTSLGQASGILSIITVVKPPDDHIELSSPEMILLRPRTEGIGR